MKRLEFKYFAIVFGLCIIAAGFWVIQMFNEINANAWGYTTWDLDRMQTSLEIVFPADAVSVSYSGHMGRGGFLNLYLEAPDESMNEFVKQFCEGTLYRAYDPFNAVDVFEPLPNAYVIDMRQPYHVFYYSYSPNTSADIQGIRCLDSRGRQIQLVVENLDDAQSSLKLEVLYTCTKCPSPYRRE